MDLALKYNIPIIPQNSDVATDVMYAMYGLSRGVILAKYLVCQKRLVNGNTLFLREDGRGAVAIESQTTIDPKTGRDVSRFVPLVVSWDDINYRELTTLIN